MAETWQRCGRLKQARARHTATLLVSGKVLVIGGDDSGEPLIRPEIHDPRTDVWKRAADILTARTMHTATLLPSGEVLVVGGLDNEARHSGKIEIYDPGADAWREVADLPVGRSAHVATLLPSGRVLVSGGENDQGLVADAWLYDPSGDVWETTAFAPNFARKHHTATLLPSNELLVVGGQSAQLANLQAEVYNSSTGAWVVTGTPEASRGGHSATLLPSGQVLVVGSLAHGDIYSPATETWQLLMAADSTLDRQRNHTATLFSSGRALVAGGTRFSQRSWIHDPLTAEWRRVGDLVLGRFLHTASLLGSGEVLVAGGFNGDSVAFPDGRIESHAEIYDPSSEAWQVTAALAHARAGHSATLLPNGEVLVVGGENAQTSLRSVEIYDPMTGGWRPAAELSTSRSVHTATSLPSGKVLVAGGATVTVLPSDQRIVQALSSAEVYDPATDSWTTAGPLATARVAHSATLLPSGQVAVVGGWNDGEILNRAEVYDPTTGTWSQIRDLEYGRWNHTATLLPSGNLLVVGGESEASQTAEIYDPAAGNWTPADPPGAAHDEHSATLLPSGRVLVIGGAGVELYHADTFPAERQPIIVDASPTLRYGEPLVVVGTGFRGSLEGSGGTSRSSPVNFPLVQLRDIAGGQFAWLVPDQQPGFGDAAVSLTINQLPPTFDPGPHILTIVTAGVISEPWPINLECSLRITEGPADQTVPKGASATFTVKDQGGRLFQWQKNDIDIPGATGASYTTPPITAADSGTTYRVRVENGCTTRTSEPAALTIADDEEPEVEIISPVGGDLWVLSDAGQAPGAQLISWEMKDNVRICRVTVRLRFSEDGGATWRSVMLRTFAEAAPGPACEHPGQAASNLTYEVPVEPPSGVPGSLYQVQVGVLDHAGLNRVVRSGSFFIVRPNDDTVRTLILTHVGRMRDKMGVTGVQVRQLRNKLRELGSHPRVQGLVVDLGNDPRLTDLYDEWDRSPADFSSVNHLLFGQGGVHERILELLGVYTGVESLIVVGDDRILPFARLRDGAVEFLESNYTYSVDDSEPGFEFSAPGLLAETTTVGMALAADRYLSDDPLAVIGEVQPQDLDQDRIFLPELAIGRLVETPEEMSAAIAAFISRDGVLDLAQLDPVSGRKVMVTAYDFLVDSGRRILERWQDALGADVDSLTPVDGALVSTDWDVPAGSMAVESRRQALGDHLFGFGDASYGIVNLNGHATHFEEGVPGDGGTFDIQGLAASKIAERCEVGSQPCLTGAVVYGVGCHGGLPVAGDGDPRDHEVDLPQTMLGLRALAYVANTGYGWGLVHGIGYSERLVEIMTEELTRGGTVVVGDAVKRSKERYFLELPHPDPYDAKTLMQWTFFGFPMYAVRTGIEPDEVGGSSSFASAATSLSDLPAVESLDGVTIERSITSGAAGVGPLKVSLPDFLTIVEQRFKFQSERVYLKRRSTGEEVSPPVEGCPDPQGCYYTLNGLATGADDLPIQPFFVFDSRLVGTSQHGVLWKGGVYQEESGWAPLLATLASNGGHTARASTPRQIFIHPRGPRRRRRPLGSDSTICPPSDLDINSVVFTTGETVRSADGSALLKLHREVDIEVFYSNNTDDPTKNCDVSGPLFRGNGFHRLEATTVHWEIPEIDPCEPGISDPNCIREGVWDAETEDVWRVVVVYDQEGSGKWTPLELEKHGDLWRASLQLAQLDAPALDGIFRLTYYVQAVDQAGNVGWLEFEDENCPPETCSESVPRIPLPVEVTVRPGAADLTVTMTDEQDPVEIGRLIVYSVQVTNRGPAAASAASVVVSLDDQLAYMVAGGAGWTCQEASSAHEIGCSRDLVSGGETSVISVVTLAPSNPGRVTSTVDVSAIEQDPDPSNNHDSETSRVRR